MSARPRPGNPPLGTVQGGPWGSARCGSPRWGYPQRQESRAHPDRRPRTQGEELPHVTNPDADWQAEALERLARAADDFSRTWTAEPRKEEGLASNGVSLAAQEVADAVKALGLWATHETPATLEAHAQALSELHSAR